MKDRGHKLTVCEIFRSIQGESTWAGRPCVFVRLTGCNLDCSYCDTRHARTGGKGMTVAQILRSVRRLGGDLVEVTGGEPLLQPAAPALLRSLCDAGKTVLLETNGSLDISRVDRRVGRIMDWKGPSSGESSKNLRSNLSHLRAGDEVKFVVAGRRDFDWAVREVRRHRMLQKAGAVLFSPAAGRRGLKPSVLARWILDSGLPIRLQIQLHRHLWPRRVRGA